MNDCNDAGQRQILLLIVVNYESETSIFTSQTGKTNPESNESDWKQSYLRGEISLDLDNRAVAYSP